MVFELKLYELAHKSYGLFSNGIQKLHEIIPNSIMMHL